MRTLKLKAPARPDAATQKRRPAVRVVAPASKMLVRATASGGQEALKKALSQKRSANRVPGSPKFPLQLQRQYFRKLLDLTDALRDATLEILIPSLEGLLARTQRKQPTTDSKTAARNDGTAEELEETLGRMRARVARSFTPTELEAYLRTLSGQAEKFNATELRTSMRKVLNVDLVVEEPWLADLMSGLISKNVALVESLQSDFYADITRRVLDAGFSGIRHEDLAKDLRDRLDIPQSKARLIARDQIATFNGQLTRFRQRELGIRKYRWVATKDERTREEHKERDGKEFYWEDFSDNPPGAEVLPPGERPGEPINCRCTARPLIDDLIEELKEGKRA